MGVRTSRCGIRSGLVRLSHAFLSYRNVLTRVRPAYHHMCAFYSYKIFSHPRIKDLTYYLRLDDDSSVLAPSCIDPFEYMHTHNKSYAFRLEEDDMGWVTDGMWPFVSNYAARHPAVEHQLSQNKWEWPPGRTWPGKDYARNVNFPSYQTNFDLVKVPRFRTSEMLAFLEELASDPRRFYWYRWGAFVFPSFLIYFPLSFLPPSFVCFILFFFSLSSHLLCEYTEYHPTITGDAPVRRAEVSMFLDVETEVHQMCEIPYAHKTFVFEGCECVPLALSE